MATTARDPIAERSLSVLREGQSAGGAFVASPTFRVYQFGWLRDGAFCAHALDVVGEKERSAAFHGWAATTIEEHRALAEAAIARVDERLTTAAAQKALIGADVSRAKRKKVVDQLAAVGILETWLARRPR